MCIEKIIIDLIHNNIIHSEPTEWEQLNGGTVSKLYLLNIDGSKYVIKLNDQRVIESEAIFLDRYKEVCYLPKLLFVEPSYNYLVYSYVNGSTNYIEKNKKEILKDVVKGLLNNYKSVSNNIGWGWADQITDSWQNFLINEVVEANKIIDGRLDREDHNFISNLVKKIPKDTKPYLIHGDCGVHNFIFNDGQLSGVIDPAPVIGDPLYDLIYAFCSSPDDLTKETIDYAVSHLMIKREKEKLFLYENVIIGLYLRLGKCIKHHPNDYEEYMKAWYSWMNITKRLII
ncbi:aminoglycoside phosphotransferase family protein [Peribacillus glennii]|uniref:Aminoglycoside phosphotransferase family protein n=1 Tax=Peribacillus glennii TaxID=2303991 RepID=A0A372L7G8_9BACI|nr:aminoglycoside phosphotransferase family protein [Peribacillus glennii]RFU61216.1 aminoglycoside phosphotransferase family protein [Peribacillus glennii]